MAWQLLHDSESLVCRVLKAKYFPTSDFLDAGLGGNPSYTWTSIHASQGLIRQGVRWKVGSDSQIPVFQCSWLDDNTNFMIRTVCTPGLEDMRVGELVCDGSNQWDRDLISAIFDHDDVVGILKTALPPPGVVDRLIWHHARDGVYSVKTGYQLAARLFGDHTLAIEGDWSRIWKLRVPPKVRDLIWRAARDCLPTKVNLFTKRIVDSKSCPLYGYVEETNWHVFVDCLFAIECWERASLQNDIEGLIWTIEGFQDLVFGMLALDNGSRAAVFGMVLWQIWTDRNSMVWTEQHNSSVEAVHLSTVYLTEWTQASCTRDGAHTVQSSTRSGCPAWHVPPLGKWKLNVDAAFFADTGHMGVGMILRDDQGVFIMARTLVFDGCLEVAVGEAMGFYEALSWIQALGLEEVIVEGDSKMVVDAILTNSGGISVFHYYIWACKRIINLCPSYLVRFVRRDANKLAHEFARASRNYESSFCWLDPPLFVVGQLDDICVCNNEN